MSSERSLLVEQDDPRRVYDSIDETRIERPTATPLPKLQLFSVIYIQLSEPITAAVIYPFVVQLVRDTGITNGNEAKTGYYAGFIESVFFAAEALTVLQWGRISDQVGRRPPLLIGALGLAIAITSFGLSTTFWMLIVSRCAQGIFNGNIGISKTIIGEITDASNIGQAFGLLPMMWAMGSTLGPAIGGVLSHPADRWPGTLGKIAFLHKNPYFLPCFVASLAPLSAFVFASIFLKETLPSAVERKTKRNEEESNFSANNATPTERVADAPPPPLRSLMTRAVLIPIINYAFLAFIEQSCAVLFPLVYATSIPFGGLGLSSFAIGIIMSTVGITNGLVSALFFSWMLRKIGIWRLYTTAFVCFFVVLGAFPVMNTLAKRAGYVDQYVWTVLVIQLCCYILAFMSFGCMFIYFADSSPSTATLGSVNGLAQLVASSVRFFSPLTASSLFALSTQHHLLNGTMVYWILWLVVGVGVYCSSRLPRRLKSDN